MQSKQPQYINSIIRALNILELYETLDVEYLGIAEISKELGLQKTTVFNIVKTLLHKGWLIQDSPNGKYKLGSRVLHVSNMVTKNLSIGELILGEMHRLRDLYNEDIVLTAMINKVPICVEKVQSSNILRMTSQVGHVSSMTRGSTGKVLLAWQPENFVKETLDRLFPSTKEGRDARDHLEAELKMIRSQGYCISISEQDEGVASVTVPIRNGNGVAEYSLAIIGSEMRIREKGLERIQNEMLITSHHLEEERSLLC